MKKKKIIALLAALAVTTGMITLIKGNTVKADTTSSVGVTYQGHVQNIGCSILTRSRNRWQGIKS